MNKRIMVKNWLATISLVILGYGMSACAMGGKASWKEEVLLHDGKRLIVERSQTRGGRREIGQEVPVAEHTITFNHPDTRKTIRWKSEYGNEAEKWSLLPLALDIVNGAPYIVTTPVGCIAYNNWEHPNPPYVVQRFDGNTWQRVPLAAFPKEIREANLVIGGLTERTERRLTSGRSEPVSSKEIKDINSEARDPAVRYLREIVREPLAREKCPQYSSGPKAPHPIEPKKQPTEYGL